MHNLVKQNYHKIIYSLLKNTADTSHIIYFMPWGLPVLTTHLYSYNSERSLLTLVDYQQLPLVHESNLVLPYSDDSRTVCLHMWWLLLPVRVLHLTPRTTGVFDQG